MASAKALGLESTGRGQEARAAKHSAEGEGCQALSVYAPTSKLMR